MNDQDLRARIRSLDGLRQLAQRTSQVSLVEKEQLDESPIDHPSYYRKDTGHEVIDLIEEWNLGFHLGNALKYLARAGLKDPSTARKDLEKAIWYIERYIDTYLLEDTRRPPDEQ